MEGSADIRLGLEEVNLELQQVERQIERLLQKQQRLLQRKEQLEQQSSRLHELSLQAGSTDWEKSDYPWSSKLQSLRESVFGINKFRSLQEKTMNASLSGRDVILLMPTGGGKSLCYQLPALVSKGFTLVVSPLLALMEDQVMALEDIGVNATVLNSNTPPESVKDVHRTMIDGRSQLKLLYVTPEKIAKSKRFMACLEKAYKAKLLARIAIDEVHCCSQWGHDFRPDYKILGLLKRQFSDAPILGLTATATMDVLEDVKGILGLQGCQIFRAGFNRPNLFYEVRPKPSKQADFVEELVRLINGEFKGQSGIIYCFSRKDAENMAEKLKDHGIRAHPYHAFLDAQYRSYVHKNWKENNIQVVVATVAFGMGIDKPDVRFVIHHSISKSMENYYQESGRAGRDDEPAKCIVYFGMSDVFRQSTMVVTEQTGQQKLYNMVAYCVTPATCRRNLIGQHFGERWEDGKCNKMCDVCKAGVPAIEKDMVTHLQRIYKILDHVSKKEERVTALKLIDELMSKKGVAPLEKEQAKKMTNKDYEYLIIHLLLEGYLREDFHFTPYNTISYILPGPKLRHHNANPQRCVTIPFKADKSHMSKVTGQSGKGWEKVKGVVKGGASSTKTSAKRGPKVEVRGDAKEAAGKGSEVPHGKAKKRKLREEPSIIDLCSDDDDGDDVDFATDRLSAKVTKTLKLSTTGEGCSTSGGKGGSEAKKKSVNATQKSTCGSVKVAQKQGQTHKSMCGTVGEKTDNADRVAPQQRHHTKSSASENSGKNVQEKLVANAKDSKILGKFASKPQHTSTPSLASPISSEGANPSNQDRGKESRDHVRDSRSKVNQPGLVKGATSNRSSVQSPRAPQRNAQKKNVSPSSCVELDLHSVYSEQLRNLGSDGESFNFENSSFTMSTSFSGSEDGMATLRKDPDNTPTSRGRRKGMMKRVDSMDNEEDESMRDDYDTLKKVYTAQLKNLDDAM